ncbi:MAG: DUF3035 domain-containing protein [Alphaproteobacteria bacterium]|nr:DUF3035 domain-containing protein [Alphaproteobacteria bacterium]
MRHSLIALLAVGAALSACSSAKETLGINRRAPDEFAVVTKAPLVIPPDFGLRPPEPGAPRLQEIDARQLASAAITGRPAQPGRVQVAGLSGSETALLRRAGAENADSSIRAIIREETTQLAEKENSFTERLLFWVDKSREETVDAQREAQRLREAQAAGQSPVATETPIRQRRIRGLLDKRDD